MHCKWKFSAVTHCATEKVHSVSLFESDIICNYRSWVCLTAIDGSFVAWERWSLRDKLLQPQKFCGLHFMANKTYVHTAACAQFTFMSSRAEGGTIFHFTLFMTPTWACNWWMWRREMLFKYNPH